MPINTSVEPRLLSQQTFPLSEQPIDIPHTLIRLRYRRASYLLERIRQAWASRSLQSGHRRPYGGYSWFNRPYGRDHLINSAP